MSTLLIAVIALLIIIFVIINAINPIVSDLSHFELERRSKMGDNRATNELKKIKLSSDIYGLKQFFSWLVYLIILTISFINLGWLAGLGIGLAVIILSPAISRTKFILRISARIFSMLEPQITKLVSVGILKWIIKSRSNSYKSNKLGSREELQYLISESDDILNDNEKKRIISGLSFDKRRVRDIMTPKSQIVSIKKSEFLGPLTLNELHKTGHSRLPVIAEDINHIIGILYIKSLLTLDIKRSTTAEKAMEAKVYYVREDHTLQSALAVFVKTHHNILIVIDKDRQTVGLLTIKDVIEALLGNKIDNELIEDHDNIHSVAKQR